MLDRVRDLEPSLDLSFFVFRIYQGWSSSSLLSVFSCFLPCFLACLVVCCLFVYSALFLSPLTSVEMFLLCGLCLQTVSDSRKRWVLILLLLFSFLLFTLRPSCFSSSPALSVLLTPLCPCWFFSLPWSCLLPYVFRSREIREDEECWRCSQCRFVFVSYFLCVSFYCRSWSSSLPLCFVCSWRYSSALSLFFARDDDILYMHQWGHCEDTERTENSLDRHISESNRDSQTGRSSLGSCSCRLFAPACSGVVYPFQRFRFLCCLSLFLVLFAPLVVVLFLFFLLFVCLLPCFLVCLLGNFIESSLNLELSKQEPVKEHSLLHAFAALLLSLPLSSFLAVLVFVLLFFLLFVCLLFCLLVNFIELRPNLEKNMWKHPLCFSFHSLLRPFMLFLFFSSCCCCCLSVCLLPCMFVSLLVNFIELSRNLELSKQEHVKALYLLKQFWTYLVQDEVDLDALAKVRKLISFANMLPFLLFFISYLLSFIKARILSHRLMLLYSAWLAFLIFFSLPCACGCSAPSSRTAFSWSSFQSMSCSPHLICTLLFCSVAVSCCHSSRDHEQYSCGSAQCGSDVWIIADEISILSSCLAFMGSISWFVCSSFCLFVFQAVHPSSSISNIVSCFHPLPSSNFFSFYCFFIVPVLRVRCSLCFVWLDFRWLTLFLVLCFFVSLFVCLFPQRRWKMMKCRPTNFMREPINQKSSRPKLQTMHLQQNEHGNKENLMVRLLFHSSI